MKIIHWNCQGAFRNKNKEILAYKPDILVISECESPSRLKFGDLTPEPDDYFWYGDNEHKGVGFFFFNKYKYSINKEFNSKFRYIIPLIIESEKWNFNLFGIWAMGDSKKRNERYIGQVWMAINHYESLFNNPSVLIGDFNSNQIWDTKKRIGNHTDMVNKLAEYNINSLYHEQTGLAHGNEKDPTFFLYRDESKPYHLDYCFISKSLTKEGYTFSVGEISDWLKLSDHLPIIVNLKD